jgi:nucleoside-diphosphate-sugar epimerase
VALGMSGRIVVTGGAGYVGSVIASHLLLNGSSVTVCDTLAGGGEALLGFIGHPRFRLATADVRDERALADAFADATAVVHLAAVVGEPACRIDPQHAEAINAGGTRTALAAAEGAGVKRFVMVSTCSNYGVSNPDVLADEDAPLRPLGIYAASKVAAEQAALGHAGRLETCVLRFGTICGLSAKMRFDLLINEMARAAVLDDPIAIFTPDAWRPFLHIRDAARATLWALESRTALVAGQVFNVVGENYQKKQLVDLVRSRFPRARIDVVDAVPDQRDYRVSGDRIRERGGFVATETIAAAFAEVADAVRTGAFRDPKWSGHTAAPALVR